VSKKKSPPQSGGVVFCGVEVSRRELLVDCGGQQRRFANSAAGRRELVKWLRGAGAAVRACLEATGQYGLDAALELHAAGVELMVVNPRAVRHFAQALLRRSKNDPLDAAVLREFAARMEFRPWQRPSERVLAVVGMARRMQALAEMITAEKNRLHAASLSAALPQVVRQEIRRSIAAMERSQKKLLQAAQQELAGEAALARKYAQLRTVRGLGERSALQVLAELLLLSEECGARQWVAHAGLDPREYRSGDSVQKKVRISRAGNARLRRALYMPALVAAHHDAHLGAFYARLRDRGKSKMSALVAVMRKLLHAIYGMFRHNQDYEGSKLFAPATS
jgi:transposase